MLGRFRLFDSAEKFAMITQTNRDRDNRERLARWKGFTSYRSYRDYLAQRRGFASYYEYRKELARRRQSNPNYQALRDLINSRLQELGKNRSWLARRIGLSRQSVSMYGQGKSLPQDDKTLRKIVSALGFKKTTASKVELSKIQELR